MNKDYPVIDAHAHCGVQDVSFHQSFASYFSRVRGSRITRVVAFAPVAEIYDRYDFDFTDDDNWRRRRTRANQYVTQIGNKQLSVIPYFFIWNDFALDQIHSQYRGIKWHRHPSEPVYHYDSDGCRAAVRFIIQKRLPVVLEEAFSNTVRFINHLAAGARVIIPHLGGLNGGYEAIASAGLWENPNVYADSALASVGEIRHYINTYGHERLLFGSDFPFGDPLHELGKITGLNLAPDIEKSIVSDNLIRLQSGIR